MIYTAKQRRAFTKVELIVTILIIAVLIAVLLPPEQSVRHASRRSQCKNNLKQIGLALVSYHDIYKCFPPAFVSDADGRPAHSWRVLLLPFLEEKMLYDQYRFDESWDGPSNAKLVDRIPPVYRCPTFVMHIGPLEKKAPHVRFLTSYVAITGVGTGFHGSRSTCLNDYTDSTSQTVHIAEVRQHAVNWMRPDDISVNEFLDEVEHANFETHANHQNGMNCLFADGYVQFVVHNSKKSVLRALCTIAGGEKFDNIWTALESQTGKTP